MKAEIHENKHRVVYENIQREEDLWRDAVIADFKNHRARIRWLEHQSVASFVLIILILLVLAAK